MQQYFRLLFIVSVCLFASPNAWIHWIMLCLRSSPRFKSTFPFSDFCYNYYHYKVRFINQSLFSSLHFRYAILMMGILVLCQNCWFLSKLSAYWLCSLFCLPRIFLHRITKLVYWRKDNCYYYCVCLFVKFESFTYVYVARCMNYNEFLAELNFVLLHFLLWRFVAVCDWFVKYILLASCWDGTIFDGWDFRLWSICEICFHFQKLDFKWPEFAISTGIREVSSLCIICLPLGF